MNGGKDFQAGAYSPLTNTMYYGLQNTCADVTAIAEKPQLGVLYAISNKTSIAPGTDKIGTIFAVSAETGKTTWKFETRAGQMSLVATGGRLLIRRRHQRRLPRARSGHRKSIMGDQSRLARHRLSDHILGRRQTVCRGQHRQLAGRAPG